MCSSLLHVQFEQTNLHVLHIKARSLAKVACVELYIVPFIMVLFTHITNLSSDSDIKLFCSVSRLSSAMVSDQNQEKKARKEQ